MTQAIWRNPGRRLWLLAGTALAAAAAVGAWAALHSGSPAVAGSAPRFVEESGSAGLQHVYGGEYTFFVGGGVAVFDCNDDLKPDVYFAGGVNPAALFRNESQIGGALEFSAVPAASTDLTEVTGAYPIDIDSDGETDLAVLRLGENVILRGLGGCRFEPANEGLGFDGGDLWTTAFSAKWEGSAALPTLAFGNYVALDDAGQREGGCSTNEVVWPSGDGYGTAVPLPPGWCTLSMLFSDWDRSGAVDLRVSNDRQYNRDGEEQLWRIAAGQPPQPYVREDGWKQVRIFGMGIASHDLTGDGLPEVFLSSMGDNKLQTLSDGTEQPVYDDIALGRGVTAHRPFVGDAVRPSTAWHAEFQDVNNDGFVDLFIAKGNVDAMAEFAAEDPNNLLLGQPDGTFTESAVDAGILSLGRTRGAALADFNLDGLVDLVEVNRREAVKLWRNVGAGTATAPESMGNWVAVELAHDGVNPDAIGSWIEVEAGGRTLYREVTVGGGHGGGQAGFIHFGLGTADEARVRVQWPDGEMGPWMEVEANRLVTVERGETEPSFRLDTP